MAKNPRVELREAKKLVGYLQKVKESTYISHHGYKRGKSS